jgi:hypothetical protein
MPAVIVTGGFISSNENQTAVSTDSAALSGARRYADDHSISLKSCFEACIPEAGMDRSDVIRMGEADGIAVRVMTGRTPFGRRLAMVAGVHMVITIAGRRHTEAVVEQAIEIGIPVLPIPDAGGDSEILMSRYRGRIASYFGPGVLDLCLSAVAGQIGNRPEVAAESVVRLICTAKVARCLILLPYDKVHDALYGSIIEPTVARHMIPVRLDRLPASESIYASFADAIRTSSAVIADVTVLNENVMYEVGFAHGAGLTPLLYTQTASRLERLPVYFRALNVRLVSAEMPLEQLVDDYLRSLKGRHRLSFGTGNP